MRLFDDKGGDLKVLLGGKYYNLHNVEVGWQDSDGEWHWADGQESHGSYLEAEVFIFDTLDGEYEVNREDVEDEDLLLQFIYPL